MLKWYKNLYVGDTAKDKKKKYIWKVNHGAGVLDLYLVTLAQNDSNHLEVFSANLLLQKSLRRICPMIVGIAKGYGEALELVEQITSETYQQTGNADIRTYLLYQEQQKSEK